MNQQKKPLIVGHRGARGLKPENTLMAFQTALKLGARGLEMDLFMTKDGQIVVSHEPTVSPELCTRPGGETIQAQESHRLKIYNLRLEEIKPYDCGSTPNPQFPEQENSEAHIPLLAEVVQKTNAYAGDEPVQLFIEWKSDPATDHIYHPEPFLFVQRTLEVLEEQKAVEQTIFLSFDKRCLQEARRQKPGVRIGLSFEEPATIGAEIDALGFLPDVLCPLHRELSKELLRYAGSHAMEVIPWTVNEEKDLRRMTELGVDGIITDYPDRALHLMEENT